MQTTTAKCPLQLMKSSNAPLYISGPMTGLPDLNRAAFQLAEAALTRLGAKVINPHKVVDFSTLKKDATPAEEWAFCMKQDLAAMYGCGGLVMLPNWAQSAGATWEFLNAKVLKMPVIGPVEPDFSQESPVFELVNMTETEYVELFYKLITKIKDHDSLIINEFIK